MFGWGESQKEAFQDLKDALSSTPVLTLPDPESGKLKPIVFESRTLTDIEQRYPIRDKELLAIIYALTKWRHYLLNMPFTMVTDHESLHYLKTMPILTPRLARWLDFIEEFDMKVIYRPGKENVVADALSRQEYHHIAVLIIGESDLMQCIKKETSKDSFANKVITLLKEGSNPEFLHPHAYKDGILTIEGRIYVPPPCRTRVLQELHDTPYSGHRGYEKMFDLMVREFYWPHMAKTIRKFVYTCPLCQRNKPNTQRPAGLLQPIPVPERPWQAVTMDLITDLPRTSDSVMI